MSDRVFELIGSALAYYVKTKVFAVVTCKTCPYSRDFIESNLEKLKKELSELNYDILHLEYNPETNYMSIINFMSKEGNDRSIESEALNRIPWPLNKGIPIYWPIFMLFNEGEFKLYDSKASKAVDKIIEWVGSLVTLSKSREDLINSLAQAKNNVDESLITKLSSKIIELKQKKKQIEQSIGELEKMENMLKTLKSKDISEIKSFIHSTEVGWQLGDLIK